MGRSEELNGNKGTWKNKPKPAEDPKQTRWNGSSELHAGNCDRRQLREFVPVSMSDVAFQSLNNNTSAFLPEPQYRPCYLFRFLIFFDDDAPFHELCYLKCGDFFPSQHASVWEAEIFPRVPLDIKVVLLRRLINFKPTPLTLQTTSLQHFPPARDWWRFNVIPFIYAGSIL